MTNKPTSGVAGETLPTGIVRLAYANLFEPRANDAGDMLYGVNLLFPSNPAEAYRELQLPAGQIEALAEEHDRRLLAIKKAVMQCAVQAYGGKEKLPAAIRNQDLGKGSGWPFRDGAQKEDSNGFVAGELFVSVSSRYKPQIVDLSNKVIVSRGDPNRDKLGNDMRLSRLSDDDVFSGVWAYVSVRPYSYANKGNHGISLGLGNIQYVREGEKLGGGGGSRPEDDFKENALGAASGSDLEDLEDLEDSSGGGSSGGGDDLDDLLG